MMPVTSVSSLSDTNNNNTLKEEWPGASQPDNDEDDHDFAHVTINILGIKSEDISDLDNWMKYHQYSSLQDIITEYFSSPHDLQLQTNYRENGMTAAQAQLVVT